MEVFKVMPTLGLKSNIAHSSNSLFSAGWESNCPIYAEGFASSSHTVQCGGKFSIFYHLFLKIAMKWHTVFPQTVSCLIPLYVFLNKFIKI